MRFGIAKRRFGIARAGTRGDSTPPSPSTTSSDEVREVGRQAMASRRQLEMNQSQLSDLERLLEGRSLRRSYADVVRDGPSVGSSITNSNMSISSAYVTAEDGSLSDNLSSENGSSMIVSIETPSHRTNTANLRTPATQTSNRSNRWTREQSEEAYICFYIAKLQKLPITNGSYHIWRDRNPSLFPYLNANTFNTYRRYYQKKLSLDEKQILHSKAISILNYEGNSSMSDSTQSSSTSAMSTSTQHNNNTNNTDDNNINILASQLYDIILSQYHITKLTNITDRIKPQKFNENKNATVLEAANMALQKIVVSQRITSLEDINALHYATAISLTNQKQLHSHTNSRKGKTNPYKRAEKSIHKTRQLIGRLISFINNKTGKSGKRKIKKLLKDQNPIDRLQSERMKLAAQCKHLRNLKAKKLRFTNNRLFISNQKRFFDKLRDNKSTEVNNPPTKIEVETFWSSIFSQPAKHNTDASWIPIEESAQAHITPDIWENIDEEIFKLNVKKISNWKAPGIDQVQNFWIKKLTPLHLPLINAYNTICLNPTTMPSWMTEGKTTLIPKNENTTSPKNYRPITCLPTSYKLLTLILSDKIYNHITKKQSSGSPILQFEQKGCRRLARGCKDQLMIDKCITKLGKKSNVSFAWIDYQKAYDSVPHSWIKKSLELYKIDAITKHFITHAMQTWRTSLTLHHSKGKIITNTMPIKSGIFQGDSLSPLLFCICLFPLTNILNRTKLGVPISRNKNKNKKTINHLLYMDDIKIFAKGKKNMDRMLNLLQTFTNDITMKLNIQKCAIISVNKGKIDDTQHNILPTLTSDDSYKYLGLVQSSDFLQKKIKENRKNEYFQRIRKIMKAQLNSINTAQAISSFAVPVLRYCFGIIHWTDTELKQVDRKVRKILTNFKFHHPLSDVNNIHLSREKGGRNIPKIADIYAQELSKLSTYLKDSSDPLVSEIKYYESCEPPTKSILRYNINGPKYVDKQKCDEKNEQLRNMKPIYGKFFRSQQDIPSIDLIKSRLWLKKSYLRFETESLLCAAQEQAIMTNWKKHVCGIQGTNPKCRFCHQHDETIMHIASGCTILASNLYTKRHNKVGTYIHWSILKNIGYHVPPKWYHHKPTPTIEIQNITIMWDVAIPTPSNIPNNRPDIIIYDRNERTCKIIDISIPQDQNINVKTAEKITKYKNLETELQTCWNLKEIVTLPIIIGAFGTVTNSISTYIKKINDVIDFNILQKTTLIGTQQIIRSCITSTKI